MCIRTQTITHSHKTAVACRICPVRCRRRALCTNEVGWPYIWNIVAVTSSVLSLYRMAHAPFSYSGISESGSPRGQASLKAGLYISRTRRIGSRRARMGEDGLLCAVGMCFYNKMLICVVTGWILRLGIQLHTRQPRGRNAFLLHRAHTAVIARGVARRSDTSTV